MAKVIEEFRAPDDLKGVTIVYELGENELYVEFFATEIIGEDCWVDGVYKGNGYENPKGRSSMDMVYEPEQGEPLVRGSVKWDGCVNFEVGGDRTVMMHACNLTDLLRISRVLERVYQRSADLMAEAALVT